MGYAGVGFGAETCGEGERWDDSIGGCVCQPGLVFSSAFNKCVVPAKCTFPKIPDPNHPAQCMCPAGTSMTFDGKCVGAVPPPGPPSPQPSFPSTPPPPPPVLPPPSKAETLFGMPPTAVYVGLGALGLIALVAVAKRS